MIKNIPYEGLMNLARTLSIFNAHVFGKLFDERYKGAKFSGSRVEVMKHLSPGVVFTAPTIEPLCDDNIGIHDLNRISSISGPWITKMRTNIVIQVKNLDVEILSVTSFSNQGKPPKALQKEVARITHQNDATDPPGAEGFPVIRFNGIDHLTKVSFVQFTQTSWTNLKRIPFAKEGCLMGGSFDVLADLLELSSKHVFRARGSRLKRDRNGLLASKLNHIAAELGGQNANSEIPL